jgi:hypothetical protein
MIELNEASQGGLRSGPSRAPTGRAGETCRMRRTAPLPPRGGFDRPVTVGTCVPMTRASAREFQHPAGPLPGRLILLAAAYSPVAVVGGLRGLPSAPAYIAAGLGLAGIGLWILFLRWLGGRGPRNRDVREAELIDSEVTGYIVSILLPVIAASAPDLNDWLAYGVCAALILVVAFAAELWAVNPITYLFGLRAARALIDGTPRVVLVRGILGPAGERLVIERIGVALILPPAQVEPVRVAAQQARLQ